MQGQLFEPFPHTTTTTMYHPGMEGTFTQCECESQWSSRTPLLSEVLSEVPVTGYSAVLHLSLASPGVDPRDTPGIRRGLVDFGEFIFPAG